jgi:hypothetical protein
LISNEVPSEWGTDFHVLTYAEEGFSPLSGYASRAGFSKSEIVEHANKANTLDAFLSFYPRAAISVIPRRYARPQMDERRLLALSEDPLGEDPSQQELQLLFEEAFRLTVNEFALKKIVLDFRTPRIADQVLRAIERSLDSEIAHSLDEIHVPSYEGLYKALRLPAF